MVIPDTVRDYLTGDMAETNPEFVLSPTVGSILRDNLDWIKDSGAFTKEQVKSAEMMGYCKTPQLGKWVDYCPDCDRVINVRYCSCNNRNCPNCQFPLQKKWIRLRQSEVIPDTPYFHIVMTIPHELNPLIARNTKDILSVLFRSSAQAVIELCADPKHLGAKPGIVSVLHTWDQQLNAHFHVHMICSAGGLTEDGRYITLKALYKETDTASSNSQQENPNAQKPDDTEGAKGAGDTERKQRQNLFFLPLKVLSSLFRGKFMSFLRELYTSHGLDLTGDLDYLNDPYEWASFCGVLYEKDWVGFIARTFEGHGDVIEYLARYTFRTAISNSRIFDYDGRYVSFYYRDNDHPGQKLVKKLEVHQFIRRLLAHTLPKSFTRVRFYGFLSNARKHDNLRNIFKQLRKKPFVRSDLMNLNRLQLMKALFPNNEIGVCPYCKHDLIVYRFDKYDIPVHPRAAPGHGKTAYATGSVPA